MITYSIVADDITVDQTDDQDIAREMATELAAQSLETTNIIISWYRPEDGQVGYLNPSGDHSLCPGNWAIKNASARIHIRATPAEKAKLNRLANDEGLNVSEYIRKIINEA